jgi:hypothetical protein
VRSAFATALTDLLEHASSLLSAILGVESDPTKAFIDKAWAKATAECAGLSGSELDAMLLPESLPGFASPAAVAPVDAGVDAALVKAALQC